MTTEIRCFLLVFRRKILCDATGKPVSENFDQIVVVYLNYQLPNWGGGVNYEMKSDQTQPTKLPNYQNYLVVYPPPKLPNAFGG